MQPPPQTVLLLSFYRVCSFSNFTGWVRSLILPGVFVLSFYRVGSASHYSPTLAENTGRKKSPSGHHRTNLSGYRPIFATKVRIDNRKNLLSSNISARCPHNMANFRGRHLYSAGRPSRWALALSSCSYVVQRFILIFLLVTFLTSLLISHIYRLMFICGISNFNF